MIATGRVFTGARIAVVSALVLMILPATLPAQAATSNSIPIASGWEVRATGNTQNPDFKTWHSATVPGVVQTDLLNNKLIPDPFYGDNEARLQWIGLTDWEYRTTFQVDPTTLAHEHVDLVFEGLDTYAEVFVNEQSVLKADNMFRSWRVPVKQVLKPGPNTLRVAFVSPITSMIPKVKALPYQLPSISTQNEGNEENVATAPFTRKAPYNYGWDWGPRFITIGIWKPVRLETWDAMRVADFHIQQQKITKDSASLAAQLEIEASQAGSATIAIAQDNAGGAMANVASHTVQLDTGLNTVSIPFRVANPKLWYPHGYGAQPRYKFSASVRGGKDKQPTTTAEVKTGLRSIELRREYDQWGRSFTFVVNGIPVFAKGANVIPFDSFPNRVTPQQHRQILQSAIDANMNMVRDWGGGYYESDDYYDICDELGLLIWQEFMFGGDMVPGDVAFQENVRQEAIEQVKRLRDHPSVVLWCGNNEVATGWAGWGDRVAFKEMIPPTARERVWQDYVVLFHDVLKSVVNQYGDPVPYWPSSPGTNFEKGDDPNYGDMHYWTVWHALAPIEMYTQQFPRFMSEFGFQSFPEMRTIASFAQPSDFAIDSVVMRSHQKNHGGNERILTYMLRDYPEPKDFASFVYMSQVLQAEAIKVGAEHLRRQRPRTMGEFFWQLNDCWPVASWASVDYFGRWKALQYYAKRFYSDLLVSPFAHDGMVDVYVVSDKLQPATGQLRTRLLDFSGNTLLDKTQDVQIAGQSSTVLLTINQKDLPANADPLKTFLVFDLKSGNETVSRNLAFFDKMRNLDLPAKPAIESAVGGAAGDYTVTLRSPALARDVYLTFGDMDVQPSDNYLDLLPGEAVTVHVKTNASLEQVKSSMKVMSLVDAFPSQRSEFRR